MKKIIFLLVLPMSLHAQRNYPALIDQYIQSAVSINQFSGSILIAKHNKIIYQKVFGTADYANTKPLDNNSMFETGNITEEFTAAAILLLKDEGKLKLTDPVTWFFPELPYATVTIKDLLTHSSGLPDYYDAVMKDKWGDKNFATNSDVVKSLAVAKVPLAWKPGTKYDEYHFYTEYPLLAAIIEKVSGLSYEDFMQQKIFVPLHLDHTKVFVGTEVNKTPRPNHTETVYFNESRQMFFPADSFKTFSSEFFHVTSGILGNTGISSTAGDLFIFNSALKNNRLLTGPTKKEMFTPYILKDTANGIFFGYGVLTGKNEHGNYVQQRDDGNNMTLGYITTMLNYPDEDFTIIVLANKAKSSSNIAGVLSYILFDKEVVPPSIHKQVSIDPLLLDGYTGNYALPAISKVYKKGGTLWVTIKGEPDLKLLPESSTKFFSSDKEYDWQIVFDTDDAGHVVKTYFIFSGLKKEAKRL